MNMTSKQKTKLFDFNVASTPETISHSILNEQTNTFYEILDFSVGIHHPGAIGICSLKCWSDLAGLRYDAVLYASVAQTWGVFWSDKAFARNRSIKSLTASIWTTISTDVDVELTVIYDEVPKRL